MIVLSIISFSFLQARFAHFHLGKAYLLFIVVQLQVMSDSLWLHELLHARLLCLSLSPWLFSNSCPLIQWCLLSISSSVISFSSGLQFFSASGSFPMGQLFISVDQSTGASASGEVLLINIRGWFPLRLTGSPCNAKDIQESSPMPQFKTINPSLLSLLYGPTVTSIHDYWKNYSFDYMDFCQQSDLSAFSSSFVTACREKAD